VSDPLPGAGRGRVIQAVTAVSGFAYGVIGADLHVLGDGRVLYVLENWRPSGPVDAAWLREAPSRMLSARHAVVAYTGREDELAALLAWCRLGSRLAVRWLHGPGGAGKTRLAARLAEACAGAGWKVVTAVHGPGSVLARPGSQDLRPGQAPGLLMIVDYADQWPFEHLAWLLSNAVLRHDVPTRVLLVARTDSAWPRTRAALAGEAAHTSAQVLSWLPAGTGAREDMFGAARDAFAARYGIADPAAVAFPAGLGEDPDMGLTLAVHVAALVAVDARSCGRRPPASLADLTIYLLDREHAHWQRRYDAGRRDQGAPTFQTPPEMMNQCVFTACLTGAVDPAAGAGIISGLNMAADPGRLLADHAACYPPAGPTVLEPLYPDRLAEDFLALTLPGHDAGYPARRWAAPTVALVAAGTSGAQVSRVITFLAAAAGRWPHVGDACLFPLLREDPRLAMAAGGTALSAVAAIAGIAPELLEAIAAILPERGRADLDVGIADITQSLTAHRLNRAANPAGRARIYRQLAVTAQAAGRWRQSAAAAGAALEIYRQLAGLDPLTHLPDVVAMLHALAAGLILRRRYGQALPVITECVDCARRRAAAAPPGTPAVEARRALGEALQAHGVVLAGLGRDLEAEKALREAVDHFRLAARGTGADAPDRDLAATLAVLAALLAGQGREELAAAAKLAAWHSLPARAFHPEYRDFPRWPASDTGSLLGYLRQPPGEPGADPVAAIRAAADANPRAHQARLASAMLRTAQQEFSEKNYEEALRSCAEAAESYRQLCRGDPAAHRAGLARALSLHGILLGTFNRFGEAMEVTGEAAELHRTPPDAAPGASAEDQAKALFAYALARLGAWNQSLRRGQRGSGEAGSLPAAALEDALEAAGKSAELALAESGRRSPGADTSAAVWGAACLTARILYALGRGPEARSTYRRLGVPRRLRWLVLRDRLSARRAAIAPRPRRQPRAGSGASRPG
jgi:tetratricopeptide (TPR) repeat protein